MSTNKQSSADLCLGLHAYRSGWRDGASGQSDDPVFVESRNEISRSEYRRGHKDGEAILRVVDAAELERVETAISGMYRKIGNEK